MKHYLFKSSMLTLAFTICVSQCVYANEEYEKDESVYVNLNSDGSVDNTTVTEWLHSDKGLNHIQDKSNLTNIKNISGEEQPIYEGENIIWESEANDLYYQGNSDEPLPFSMNVSYQLDGQAITANELVGKSGQLKMTIQLHNDSVTTQQVNGETINVSPLFPVVIIVNMPLEQFNNVNVNHGTIVSEGKNQIVTMSTILGLDKIIDDIDSEQLTKIKDNLVTEFTISATVETMDVPSVMLASTCASSGSSIDGLDMSELTNGIDDLEQATTQILDGTIQLKDANIELNDKMGEFVSKVDEYQQGVDKVESGSQDLSEGTQTLSNGIASLQTQMNLLIKETSGMDFSQMGDLLKLVDSTMESFKDVPNQLEAMKNQLNTVADELSKVEEILNQQFNYDVILTQVNKSGAPNMIINSINQEIGQSIDKISAPSLPTPIIDLTQLLANNITANAVVDQENIRQLLVDNGIAEETINTIMETINNSLSSSISYDIGVINSTVNQSLATQLPDINALMEAMKGQLKEGISSALNTNVDQVAGAMATVGQTVAQTQAKAVQESLNTKMNEMSSMITSANELLNNMTTTVNAILDKTKDIDFNKIAQLGEKLPLASAGIQQLVDGGNQLNQGAIDLHDGIVQLQKATNQINDATHQFKDATQKLAESTGELNDGVTRFSQEGIEQLNTKVNDAINDLNQAMNIVNTYLDESNIYSGYGDSIDGIQPSFKIIMKTKEVKYQPEQVETVDKPSESTTLWQRFINLFN